jgi:hypothetical protein
VRGGVNGVRYLHKIITRRIHESTERMEMKNAGSDRATSVTYVWLSQTMLQTFSPSTTHLHSVMTPFQALLIEMSSEIMKALPQATVAPHTVMLTTRERIRTRLVSGFHSGCANFDSHVVSSRLQKRCGKAARTSCSH